MCRPLVVVCAALLLSGSLGSAQGDADGLKKLIDLGTLGEFFELVDVRAVGPGRVGPVPVRPGEDPPAARLILMLKAKKDVDTSKLHFKIGSFDKENTLLRAVPLQFGEGFPLRKGEAVRVRCDVLFPAQFQGKLVVRETAPPKAGKSVSPKK